jgi:hypothetical protein
MIYDIITMLEIDRGDGHSTPRHFFQILGVEAKDEIDR